MNTTQTITVTLIGLLAVISPGPDFLIVVRNSLLHGRKIGLATAFGISLGSALWVAMSLLGVSYLISKWVLLFSVLKLIGALYLIYLGIQPFRKKKYSVSMISERSSWRVDKTTSNAFFTGLLTNLLNPKAALFFVSFFSVILTPETPKIMCAVYGLEISFIALVWFSIVASVLSVSRIKGIFEQTRVGFERVTGALIVALGLKLIFSRSK